MFTFDFYDYNIEMWAMQSFCDRDLYSTKKRFLVNKKNNTCLVLVLWFCNCSMKFYINTQKKISCAFEPRWKKGKPHERTWDILYTTQNDLHPFLFNINCGFR